jgi:transcriptional regulator with GAF, ATPase, and Fis domain
MTEPRHDIGDALTAAARAINSPGTLEETLDAIVHTALRSIPGFDHVGISITHRNGRVETKAATDQFVWQLDSLQYELGEGPCLDAIVAGNPETSAVLVEHAPHEQRWPRYIPQALKAGLKAQLGIQLYTESDTLGGINLYSTTNETIDPQAVHTAELFAAHAALALGHARKEEQLNEGMATRKAIGQAIGIIMERYQIDEDRAFQFLVRASSTSNIKLRLIAEEVIQLANDRAHGHGHVHVHRQDGARTVISVNGLPR